MMDYLNLNVVQEEGVLTILLDRPKANAFSLEMIEELIEVLKWTNREPTVRCLILSGQGEYFSTGQDI